MDSITASVSLHRRTIGSFRGKNVLDNLSIHFVHSWPPDDEPYTSLLFMHHEVDISGF